MSLREWPHLPPGYTSRYELCYGGVYWHLSCRGERVNGGVGESMEDAQVAALQAAWQYMANALAPDSEDHDVLLSLLTRRALSR